MSVSISKLLNLAFGIKDVILKNFTIQDNKAIFECHLKKKHRDFFFPGSSKPGFQVWRDYKGLQGHC